MIELWAIPVGVLIGYVAVILFDEPAKETTGFLIGVWFMYGLTYLLR